MDSSKNSIECLALLSHLLLGSSGDNPSSETAALPDRAEDISAIISTFSSQDFDELWSLANSHHVIVRTFPTLHEILLAEKHERADWARDAMIKEKARIDHALSF